MRLFIAIDFDDDARAAIADEQRRLKVALAETRSAIKWVDPARMHVTLVFLGEVGDAVVPAIVETVDQPIPQQLFDLVFSGIGVFPARGAPNVLWLGTSAGAADCTRLQRELATRVSTLGIAIEDRAFHPHLTLGRWKASRPSDRGRALALDSARRVARMHVDHATLYQSRLSPSGPTYTPLARANLHAPG